MKANASPMSVADYCHDFNNRKVVVNEDYQRNDGLWANHARSFFIESILLEYPIPKLYLYARLDLKTRQTVKEIVDGQQRTQALVAFYNNRLRLSSKLETEELRSLKYNQLADEWQTKFLSYSLPIDQFSGVGEDEVREAFRRMNSSNVPLNDEEQRNAKFQGEFKWFVLSISERYAEVLLRLGLFSRRDLVRMADLRTYAEVLDVIDVGFQTVKGKQIDDLYKRYNSSFELEPVYRSLLTGGIDEFLQTPELHRAPFLKAHMFQSILLALISRRTHQPFEARAAEITPEAAVRSATENANLETLANALLDPESYPGLFPFIQASTQKTNVQSSKAIRYIYFRQALNAEGG